jgi:rare lipoprotein A
VEHVKRRAGVKKRASDSGIVTGVLRTLFDHGCAISTFTHSAAALGLLYPHREAIVDAERPRAARAGPRGEHMMTNDKIRVELVPILLLSIVLAAACTQLKAHAASPASMERHQAEIGKASWYGKAHHGQRTASGERFDMHALTAAHRTLPFGTIVRVTDFKSRRSVNVRINDRGPFRRDRIIDLSYEAARKLGLLARGAARVEITVVDR